MSFLTFFSPKLDAQAQEHFMKEFILKINLRMSYCQFQPLTRFNLQGDRAGFLMSFISN